MAITVPRGGDRRCLDRSHARGGSSSSRQWLLEYRLRCRPPWIPSLEKVSDTKNDAPRGQKTVNNSNNRVGPAEYYEPSGSRSMAGPPAGTISLATFGHCLERLAAGGTVAAARRRNFLIGGTRLVGKSSSTRPAAADGGTVCRRPLTISSPRVLSVVCHSRLSMCLKTQFLERHAPLATL